MDDKLETMKSLKFGVENEYEYITRNKMAKAIQSVVGGTLINIGPHHAITVVAEDGRSWMAMNDGSLANGAEMVTPILGWDDIPTYQEVIRAIVAAGAKAPASTSQHVHVGVADMNAEQLTNLVRYWYKQEELILKALGTLDTRLRSYARATDRAFVDRILNRKPKTLEALNEAWFGCLNLHPAHYDPHRYRSLNLNPVWEAKRTVEFRAANGTCHAGEAKAAIILALAMVAKAKLAKASSAKNPRQYRESSSRYDFRVALLHLGLIGKEFKTVRMHLLKRLHGSSAWHNTPENA